MSRTFQFQDDWGDEQDAHAPELSGDVETAILSSDLPFYAEVIRNLSQRQWQVFELVFIKKVTSTAQIAEAIGVRNTGDIRKHIARIKTKLATLNANLTLVKFSSTKSGKVVAYDQIVSRAQPSLHQADPNKYQPTCLSSATYRNNQQKVAI